MWGASTLSAAVAAARGVAAELAGAEAEQLRVQRAGAERVGDSDVTVERERGVDLAVDLGDEHAVLVGGDGEQRAGAAVAVEGAEARERRGVIGPGGADHDVRRIGGGHRNGLAARWARTSLRRVSRDEDGRCATRSVNRALATLAARSGCMVYLLG